MGIEDLVGYSNHPVRGQEQDIKVTAAPIRRDIRHLSHCHIPSFMISQEGSIDWE